MDIQTGTVNGIMAQRAQKLVNEWRTQHINVLSVHFDGAQCMLWPELPVIIPPVFSL
jgi:hypothetical protein